MCLSTETRPGMLSTRASRSNMRYDTKMSSIRWVCVVDIDVLSAAESWTSLAKERSRRRPAASPLTEVNIVASVFKIFWTNFCYR